MRSALTAKGDVLFDELTTILKNEESQLERDEGLGSIKVFVATFSASASHMMPSPQVVQSGPGLLGPIPQYYHAPMYQNPNPQESSAYFPIQIGKHSNYGGSQRQKGGRGFPYGQNNKVECQICGKTNHTAY